MHPLPLLAALLALLATASTATAATTPNLVVNPGAEEAPGPAGGLPGWQGSGPAVTPYGQGGFPSTAVSQEITGGAKFFSGGNSATSSMLQNVDLSEYADIIEGGSATLRLTGAVGGYSTQEDHANVVVNLSDAADAPVGTVAIGPVSSADRAGKTTLLPRSACGPVPASARRLTVNANFTRASGAANDGYVDNVAVTISDRGCSSATALEPAAPPVPGVSGNAQPVSGRVTVRLPGTNRFVNLEDVSKVPVGTEINATRGVVGLQTAAGTAGGTQTAHFSDGQFTITQAPAASITELKLSGKLDKCSTRKGRAITNRRRLWGNGTGRFRTRGRRASASVRGTRWYTEDSCKGTLVRVREGSVVVRDFRKKRNITVKAPGRYLAK